MTFFGSTTTPWTAASCFSATAAILMGALACQSPPPAPQAAANGTAAQPGEESAEPGDAGAKTSAPVTPGSSGASKPSPAKTAAPEVLDGGQGLALTRGAQTTGQLRVSLRGIEVSDGTDAPKVIMGMRAGFQSCYEKAAAAGSKWQGAAELQLKLAASGAVESAKVASTEPGFPEALGACIRKRATAVRFDKEAPKELTFTAVFKSVP